MDESIKYSIKQVIFAKLEQNRTLGMIRALKTIKKTAIPIEDKKRLFNEMKILRKLDHPNIIKLYELFQDNENFYLITEYSSFQKNLSSKGFVEEENYLIE